MNDLPPLISLRAFEVVFRTGGIRVAARELGISHSSVSHHISQLEAWLGTPLFERSKGRRSLELTFAGEQLGSTVGAAFGEITRTTSLLRQQRRRNEVVVSISQSLATRWLLPRLHNFTDQFPDIEISVQVDQRVTDFTKDAVDLALRMGRGNWPGVDAEPLMDDVLFPVINASILAQFKYLSEELILSRFPLLHDLDPDAGWQAWKDKFGPEDLDLQKGTQITSTDLILRAAILKQGVALARGVLVQEDLEKGQLARLSGQQLHLKDAYWLVQPLGRKKSSAVQHFVDWVKVEAEAVNKELRVGGSDEASHKS